MKKSAYLILAVLFGLAFASESFARSYSQNTNGSYSQKKNQKKSRAERRAARAAKKKNKSASFKKKSKRGLASVSQEKKNRVKKVGKKYQQQDN